eukprot:jgi/Ulvmu1/11531/UM078_0020.1
MARFHSITHTPRIPVHTTAATHWRVSKTPPLTGAPRCRAGTCVPAAKQAFRVLVGFGEVRTITPLLRAAAMHVGAPGMPFPALVGFVAPARIDFALWARAVDLVVPRADMQG